MNTYVLNVLVVALTLSSSASLADASQVNVKDEVIRIVPEDLYRYIKDQGCSQVATFYKERAEVRNPPYVYGVLSPDAQTASQDFTAAFWCEQPDRGAKKYVLLLKLDGRAWPGGCPNRIEGQDFVGGLSIIRNLNDPLEWYWNMHDQKPVGKPSQRTNGTGIQSIYDGTGNIYYCHEGKWVARPLD